MLVATVLLGACGGAPTPTPDTEYDTPDAMIKAAGSAGYECGTERQRSTDVGVREFVICEDGSEFSAYLDAERIKQDAIMVAAFAEVSVLTGPNWIATFPSRHNAASLHEVMGGELLKDASA